LLALGFTDGIHLQFSFKKVALSRKITKMLLPHSFVDATTAICLIVGDLDRNNREYSITVDFYKEKLIEQGVTQQIEIIPLKQLKLEYKEYESKRNLLALYDVFLADARVIRLLPSLLGKEFYKRKRQPLQVDVTCKDLKKEISRALTTCRCIMAGRGSSGQVTVGRLSQSVDDVTDNVMVCVQSLATFVPGGSTNIRSLHLKAQDSLAVPIYVSFGSKEKVELPKRKRPAKAIESEEVTTVLSGKVRVTDRGAVRVIKPRTKTKS
jgi:ribosome biogenesis protein UTP30